MANRKHLIGVRVDEEELAAMEGEASRQRRKLADWLRWGGMRECGGPRAGAVSEGPKTAQDWAVKMAEEFGGAFVRAVKETVPRAVWAEMTPKQIYDMVKAEREHSRG